MKLQIAKHHDQGSVLMETVIVLPLFMVLMGGIMWSGQLIYDKQNLIIADRYVAWNYGNRFAQNYSDVQSRFFNESTPDTVASINPVETASSPWWHEVHGAVALNATMPVWTKGWFYPMYYMEEASGVGTGETVPESVVLYGRDLTGDLAGGHTIVMQKEPTPADSRSAIVNPNGDIGVDPGSIYSENWPAQ
jgi:hypothetical protein